MKPNATIRIGDVEIANDKPLTLIAGPCALESRSHAFEMAGALKEIAAEIVGAEPVPGGRAFEAAEEVGLRGINAPQFGNQGRGHGQHQHDSEEGQRDPGEPVAQHPPPGRRLERGGRHDRDSARETRGSTQA